MKTLNEMKVELSKYMAVNVENIPDAQIKSLYMVYSGATDTNRPDWFREWCELLFDELENGSFDIAVMLEQAKSDSYRDGYNSTMTSSDEDILTRYEDWINGNE